MRRDWKIAACLMGGVYLFSGLSRVATSFDSRWTVYVVMSLWEHGDTNLDEYSQAIVQNDFYALECVGADGHVRYGPPESCDGHWYNFFPMGGPILAAPLILGAVGTMKLVGPLFARIAPERLFTSPVIGGFMRGDYDRAHPLIEMEVASLLLAAATVVMYFIARRFLPEKRAIILALLYALATSAYSVGGRALWQHTIVMLLLAIIILLLLRAEDSPSLAAWAGIPVALSYVVRPTGSLFVVAFTAYVAFRHRAYLWRYLLAAAPIATIFLAYNFSTYHAMLSPYYHSPLGGFLPANWGTYREGLAGNLISPSRGLFVYTPVFLFAIWSMAHKMWKAPLARTLTVLALAHWIVVSALTIRWWAGMCYGPRYFSDLTPLFVVFLIPYFMQWDTLSRVVRIAFVALALIGLGIHLRGGWSEAVYKWNVLPVSVDEHPERNWDWSDPPFLRWRME